MKKLFLLLFISKIINCSESCSDLEKNENFRLEKLNDQQMSAGITETYGLSKIKYYTVSVRDFSELHKIGNIADNKFLLDIFFNSVFRYYTVQTLYFMELKPFREQFEQFKSDDKIPPLKNPIDLISIGFNSKGQIIKTRRQSEQILSYIEAAIKYFKENEMLQKLAIAFERMKIVVEKLNAKVKAGKSEILKTLLEQDRLLIDIQTMVFHMIKQGYEQYIEKVRKLAAEIVDSFKKDSKPLDKITQEDLTKFEHLGDFLKTFKPSFICAPYYKNIISKLDELQKPISEVDGIKLGL